MVWRQGPSSGQQGSRAIITASGQLHGWIGGACAEPVVLREAQRVIADRQPKLLLLGEPGQFGASIPDGMVAIAISCQSEGALQVYIEPVIPTPHLIVVGRSPMALTLADLARALEWRADVYDGPDFSAAELNAHSIVVVATQGHGDEEAIEKAVSAFPAFVGLVASHKRGQAVLGYLADRGVPQNLLDRVRVPVGLDLGHTTHREIAVAVLAELVQLRAAGELVPVRCAGRRAGRAHRGGRPGVRHDGQGRPVQPSAGARRRHVLLLLRGLPRPLRQGPARVPARRARQPGGLMLIKSNFEVAQPVDKVWRFFDDIPAVAACLPGTELTDDLGDNKYRGKVAIRMGPVRLQFAGNAEIKERDDAAKRIVVDAAGSDERGRGQAALAATASLVAVRGGTRVDVSLDLQLSGAAAQYGRGMISDVTEILMRDFATRMQARITRSSAAVAGPGSGRRGAASGSRCGRCGSR